MSPAVEDGRNNDPWPNLPWQPDLDPADAKHVVEDQPPFENRFPRVDPCPHPHMIPGGPTSPDEAENCRCQGGPASHPLDSLRARLGMPGPADGNLADDDPPCSVPAPPLGPGELRALLRECVNVVEPGDILIIRVPPGEYTWDQLDQFGESVNLRLAEVSDGQVRALVVPAEEIKVLHPAPSLVTFNSPPGDLAADEIKAARQRLDQLRGSIQ